MPAHRLAAAALLPLLACAATPPPASPTPPPASASAPAPASASAPLPPPDPAPGVSVVRFDDLGVSFAVPPGYHVIGDDQLAASIRATANPRLTAALQSRASQHKAVPLLTLSRETTEAFDGLTLTLTAAVVPQDATPAELLMQQQLVMQDNLDAFEVVEGPVAHTQDGVPGVELADRYALRGDKSGHKLGSRMRLQIRAGLAISIVAVYPDGSAARAADAKGLLDGLRFYAPLP